MGNQIFVRAFGLGAAKLLILPLIHCAAHQNARGGLFFVVQDAALTASVTALMTPP